VLVRLRNCSPAKSHTVGPGLARAPQVIPAAKKPGPGRPRKAEKEPWRARVPSTYSRFVKEAYAQAEKDVADVKNATSVMPSIAKLWREAPQSQKDRFALRRPACQCHSAVLRAGD
jgi:hypothetical protein